MDAEHKLRLAHCAQQRRVAKAALKGQRGTVKWGLLLAGAVGSSFGIAGTIRVALNARLF